MESGQPSRRQRRRAAKQRRKQQALEVSPDMPVWWPSASAGSANGWTLSPADEWPELAPDVLYNADRRPTVGQQLVLTV